MHRLRLSLEQLDQVIDELEQSLILRDRKLKARETELVSVAATAQAQAEAAQLKSERQAQTVGVISGKLDSAIHRLEAILKE